MMEKLQLKHTVNINCGVDQDHEHRNITKASWRHIMWEDFRSPKFNSQEDFETGQIA